MAIAATARAGRKLVLDPENTVPEIYEGNNEVKLVVTP